MKKNTILLLAGLILGAFVSYDLFNRSAQKAEISDEREFAVENTAEIQRIFMADRSGNKVDLVRKKDHWQYNGHYKARPNAVENLLETIRKVVVRYRPAKALEKQMIEDLSTHGIKVEIYGSKGQKLRSYYVGGVTPDETGTYMIKEGAEQPFVTTMPGFEGGLRVRYLLKERDWRDRTIFSAQESDIQRLSVAYPKQKNQSFRLEKTAEGWRVLPFYKITPKINKPVKPGYIQGYLHGFENLIAESFENDSPIRDSIVQLIPFCIITLETSGGEETTAHFHGYEFGGGYNPEGQAFSAAGGTFKNIERYLVEITTGDFMLAQHRVMKQIFWGYSFFFEGSGPDL